MVEKKNSTNLQNCANDTTPVDDAQKVLANVVARVHIIGICFYSNELAREREKISSQNPASLTDIVSR